MRAAASMAMGVIERQLATAPIRIEENRRRIFMSFIPRKQH
jgi:hypothetical protein